MAYNPTTWKDQIVTDPTKYKITKENGAEELVNIEKVPGEIIQEGTRITADKLNNIEEGIKGAAGLVGNLAGEGRTGETVKKNADDIGSLSTQMADLETNKLDKSNVIIGRDMQLQRSSVEQGASIKALAFDDDYIYAFPTDPIRKILKLRKTDFFIVRESPSTSGDIADILVDDVYLYYAYSTYINRLTKSNMSNTSSSTDGQGTAYNVIQDDNYLYLLLNNDKIQKKSKSDLSTVAISNVIGNGIYEAVVDNDFIYIISELRTKITKINKTALSVVAEITVPNNFKICQDENYIYTGGSDGIVKRLKSDLSEVAKNNSYTGNFYILDIDDNYLYFLGGGIDNLTRINKNTLAYVSESISSIAGSTSSFKQDDNYIYTNFGQKVNVVLKHNEIIGIKGLI